MSREETLEQMFDEIEKIRDANCTIEDLLCDFDEEDLTTELTTFVAELLSESQDEEWTETPWGQKITLDDSNFSKGYRTALLSVAQRLSDEFCLEGSKGFLDTRQISSIKDFISDNL
jgi:hypothetical protein